MTQSNPSTPANKQSGKGAPEPSPQEARFFFSIIKNMQNKPDIDWALVAEENGLKNAKVAATRYGQMKQKLGLDDKGPGPRGKNKGAPATNANRVNKPKRATRKKQPMEDSEPSSDIKDHFDDEEEVFKKEDIETGSFDNPFGLGGAGMDADLNLDFDDNGEV